MVVFTGIPGTGFKGTWDIQAEEVVVITYHYRSSLTPPVGPDKHHSIPTGDDTMTIKDTVTGEVFQLFGKYAQPSVTEWNSQYLVGGYCSGEVLILDFNQIPLQPRQADN